MLYYRTLELNQIEDFWKLLNTLDAETDYMMYEPNERIQTTNVQELKNDMWLSLLVSHQEVLKNGQSMA